MRQEQLAVDCVRRVEHERILAALQSSSARSRAFPASIYRMGVLESRVNENRVSEIYEEITAA